MKNKILVSCLVLVIIGAFFYFLLSQKPEKVVTEQPVSQNLPNTDQSVSISIIDWEMYKNDKYGFELTFNDAWKGLRIQEFYDAESDINNIGFQIPTTEGYATALFIGVYPKNVWKEIQNGGGDYDQGESRDGFLAENDKYVFTNIAWDNGPDLGNIDVQKILSTFKFTK